MILQLTFVDEVGSQLDSLDLGRGVGRQLVPGLLYIENDNGQQQQKQNTYKVTRRCEMSFIMTCPGLLRRIKLYICKREGFKLDKKKVWKIPLK